MDRQTDGQIDRWTDGRTDMSKIIFEFGSFVKTPKRNLLRAIKYIYRGADKSLARPTSRCILFDGENISFDSSLLYI
jgi:hypothetical protein